MNYFYVTAECMESIVTMVVKAPNDYTAVAMFLLTAQQKERSFNENWKFDCLICSPTPGTEGHYQVWINVLDEYYIVPGDFRVLPEGSSY